MTEKQFIDITKWQKETFGQATPHSKIAHLKEEIKELDWSITSMEPEIDIRNEFAECFLLLFGAAGAHGMSYHDICDAIDNKMKINRLRVWGATG